MPTHSTGSWAPVALSQNLPVQTVMPVVLSGESLALWRSASGRLTASADRCPHRGMRLSHGFVRGEALSCIYHGWSYGQSGQCLKIPAHPSLTPPAAIRVATFAATERDGVIWVGQEPSDSEPPVLDGVTPLRSMSTTAGIEALEAVAGAKSDADGVLIPAGNASGLSLLLYAQSKDETLIHVLLPNEAGAAQRIAASRDAEALRRAAEALSLQGAAA